MSFSFLSVLEVHQHFIIAIKNGYEKKSVFGDEKARIYVDA